VTEIKKRKKSDVGLNHMNDLRPEKNFTVGYGKKVKYFCPEKMP
jgi:hypothetical protein